MAAVGGANVIISMQIRAPIITKALNRKKSPIANPTTPDIKRQTHECRPASVGSRKPRIKKVNMLRKINPINRRIKLTFVAPFFFSRDTYNNAPKTHNNAANKAYGSPLCVSKTLSVFSFSDDSIN
jgi:hypothetical protein